MKKIFLFCVVLLANSLQATIAVTVVDRPAPQGQNDSFGWGMAVVADQNSDGIQDLVVGSPYAAILNSSLLEPGRANVVSGATGDHLSAILPPVAVDYGVFGAVLPLGDFTGDGIAEFAIVESRICYVCTPQPVSFGDARVHLYNGSSLSLLNTFTHPSSATNVAFGQDVQSVPDTNNDGVAEIAISASNEVISGQTYKGKIYIYSGATYGLLNTLSSPSLEANGFGYAVEGIPDLSGDGKGDLIVGCPASQGSGAQSSMTFPRIYAIDSQTGAIIREFVNPTPSNGGTAISMSIIADQTSDSVGELLVGLFENQIAGSSNRGKVMVFNTATGSAISTISASNANGRSEIGINTGVVHDLNGDSVNDYYYAVGSTLSPAYVDHLYNGQIVFVNGATNAQFFLPYGTNDQDYGFFFRALSHPDLNGDNKPDMVFAATGQEASPIIGASQNHGRIFLVSNLVPDTTATIIGNPYFSNDYSNPSNSNMSETFYLSNSEGLELLGINSIQLTNNASGVFQFATVPSTADLLPGHYHQIIVNFVPVTDGVYTANLVIDTDANDLSLTLTATQFVPENYNNRPIYFSADDKVYLIQTENTSLRLVTDNTKTGSPLNSIFAMSYESPTSLLLQNFITSSGGDKFNLQRVNLMTGNRTTVSDDTNTGQGNPMGAVRDMIIDAPRNRVLASSPVNGLVAIDLSTGNRSNVFNSTGYSSITQAPSGEIYCLPTSQSRIDQFNPGNDTFTSISLPSQNFNTITGGTIFAKSATELVGHNGFYNPVSLNLTNQTITELLSSGNLLNGFEGGPSMDDSGYALDTSGYDIKAGYFLRNVNQSVFKTTIFGIVLMEETSLFRRTLINTTPLISLSAVNGTRVHTVTVPYETFNESSVPAITLGNTTYDLPGGARLTFFNNQSVSILETNFFPGTAQTLAPNPYPGIWTFGGLTNGTFSCGMRFPYDATTVAQAGLNEQNAVIYRSTDNGATWQPVPTTVNASGDYVETTNPVSAFSQWTIGFTPTANVENWSMHE